MFSRAVLFVLLFSATALADENAQPLTPAVANYTLIVDQNVAGSAALLRGEYDAAITAARYSIRNDQDLSGYLTLCVAYIRSKQLDAAQLACDGAVKSAQAPITTPRNPHGHKNREGLAKAHMNRGVLFSLLGNPDAARSDFVIALKQRRQTQAVRHNMRLNEAGVHAASTN